MEEQRRGELVEIAADDTAIAVSCLPEWTSEDWDMAWSAADLTGVTARLDAWGTEDNGTEWFCFSRLAEEVAA